MAQTGRPDSNQSRERHGRRTGEQALGGGPGSRVWVPRRSRVPFGGKPVPSSGTVLTSKVADITVVSFHRYACSPECGPQTSSCSITQTEPVGKANPESESRLTRVPRWFGCTVRTRPLPRVTVWPGHLSHSARRPSVSAAWRFTAHAHSLEALRSPA